MTDTKRRVGKRGNGEGSITKRSDGIWQARVMVGYLPNGKPDRRYVYGKTRDACQEKLDDLRQRQRGGLLADARTERDTVAAFLERWVQSTETSVRPKTHKRYAEIVRLHLVPGLGRHKLTALKPDAVQQFYADKLASGLLPRTVHHCHAVLHRALDRAVKWGYLPLNVCERVDPPSVPRFEFVPPNPAEFGRLLDRSEAAGDRLVALWALAGYTGCRQGELLALGWEDVDLQHGRLTVRRNLLSATGGAPLFGEPNTAGSRRTITLPSEAVDALISHRDRQSFERQRLGEGWTEYGLVFTSTIGTALDQRNVIRLFKAALERSGLRSTIRFHDLRHAHATMMRAAGVDLKTVSMRLGHSTIAITSDLYTHGVAALDIDAADRLGALIRRVRNG